ncbi:MAG: 16S rRNA processing protein RimM [Alphaproteobacteria bacterium]|nr:16S rRNA processing protein RimM [Alphaproteobacteria bacterium]
MARRPPDPRFTSRDVRLGYVSGVHGLRGEVKVFLYNEASDLLDRPGAVVLVGPDGTRRTVHLTLRDGAGRRILGRIEGVEDREAAHALMGHEFIVDETELPTLDEFTWYQRDLIGLPVETASGRPLGRIAEIHDAGEVDVWMLRGEGRERVLPALRAHILSVTLAADGAPGRVVVTDDAVDEQPPL